MSRTCACQVLLVLAVLAPVVAAGQPYERDFGVVTIVAPAGTMTPRSIVPVVRVGNFGSVADTGRAYYYISLNGRTVYSDSRIITTLGAGVERDIQFRTFVGGTGAYVSRCSLALAGDENPVNDRLDSTFVFVWTTGPTWVARRNVTAGPQAKPVKDGGALCWGRYSGGGQVLFALKGNGTNEFYRYHVSGDSWHALTPVPFGERERMVKKGSALAYSASDTVLYCLKGNNTREFWKYDAVGNRWERRRDLPPGESGRAVKGGAGLVFHQQGNERYVYALKGNRTREFWRYHDATDQWELLKSVPEGPRRLTIADGSAMTNAAGNVYALKGSGNEFCRYSIAGDSWVELKPMPLTGAAGRRRKAKSGTGLAWGSSIVAALKGGYGEFWGYHPAADTWYEMESLPRLPSGKTLKKGGALAHGSGYFWALKGNRTSEFYRYTQGTDGDDDGEPALTRPVEPAAVAGRQAVRFGISPNPARDRAVLSLTSSPIAHNLSLSVYDATGRCVLVDAPGFGRQSSSASLDLRFLPAGVYLVRLNGAGFSVSQKLVIER